MLNLNNFTKVSKHRDGLDHVCRDCRKNDGITGIYKIMSPTGKVYIGQSRRVMNRFSSYRSLECEDQPKLYNSLNKHGVESHDFRLIHQLPKDVEQEVLDSYELLYWEQYIACGTDMLNIKQPGTFGKHSHESRKRMSEWQIGRVLKPNREDLVSKVFGRLTVVSFHESYRRNKNADAEARWLCKCSCGKETIVKAGNLRSGAVKSCGCLRNAPSFRRKDLTGKVIGKLTVLSYSGTIKGKAFWLCRCECGKFKTIVSNSLSAEKSKSCGCFRPKRTKK